METTARRDADRQVARLLAGLVVGREPAASIRGLERVARLLETGRPLRERDAAAFARLRHRYGHELAQLRDADA